MTRPRRKSVDYLVYVAVRLVVCVAQMMTVDQSYAFARWLAKALYRVDKRHRVVGMENLSHAFGDRYTEAERDRIHRPGTLFSAGLITGEALMGIAIAIPIVVSERADVLALPAALHFSQWFGLAVLAVVGWLLYRSATQPAK